ncbi:hypothetical protein EDD15DRAFT_2198382 [Pisolithus albus]|nr:hypothetical protein EDD15DRAFT_2198382 [Pisolithus albus]
MFEPTFTVTFHIPSPRPPGIELEPDFFSSQIGDSGTSASAEISCKDLAGTASFVVSSEPASKSMPGVFAPEAVCPSTEYRRRASVENPTVTMQKTPESDLQADVRKVALGSTPLFQKFRRAIRSREEVTSWYRSQSSVPMDEPPLSCHLYSEALCESDLFINVCSGVVKAWIWRGKAWAPIKEERRQEQVIFHVEAGFGTFLNPATKADVEAGKDGDDKEEITLPSFFSELRASGRDNTLNWTTIGREWVLQRSMPIFQVEKDVSGDTTAIRPWVASGFEIERIVKVAANKYIIGSEPEKFCICLAEHLVLRLLGYLNRGLRPNFSHLLTLQADYSGWHYRSILASVLHSSMPYRHISCNLNDRVVCFRDSSWQLEGICVAVGASTMGPQSSGWPDFPPLPPPPFKLSVFQDPDEDIDSDVTVRGYSSSEIESGNHQTKDRILDNFPLSSIENSDNKGKDAAKSLLSPDHDVSGELRLLIYCGRRCILMSETNDHFHSYPCTGQQRGAALQMTSPIPPLQYTHGTGTIDRTPVKRRDLHLSKETAEVGLTNVVREAMTLSGISHPLGLSLPSGAMLTGRTMKHYHTESAGRKDCRDTGDLIPIFFTTQCDSPFTDVPTKAEVEAYTPAIGPPCTPDRFRVDLCGVPVARTRTSLPHTSFFTVSVMHTWIAPSLRKKFVSLGNGTPDNMKSSAETRQQAKSAHAVEELGMPGMSFDDPDHESSEGSARYAIVSKGWQSSERLVPPSVGVPQVKYSSRCEKNFYAQKLLVSLTQEAFDELELNEQILPVGIADGLREFFVSLPLRALTVASTAVC